MRDQRERITFRDGSLVRRKPGETIIEAASKCKGMQSHFFTMHQDNMSDYYQSEVETDDEYEAEVLAAEHRPKVIREGRKEVFDGVAVPTRKGKENVKPTPLSGSKQTPAQSARMQGRSGIGTRANPSREEKTMPDNPKPSRGPQEFKSTPMDIRQPRQVNEPVSDVPMEDVQPSKQDHTPERPTGPKPRAPLRQSQVSAQVGETQVVTTILNTPVTMKIGEVLASSRELSDQLSSLIKRKNPRPAVVNHAVISPKDAGKLIRIPLRIENYKVSGIIDTGSELNVINRKIIRGLSEAPVDPRRKVVMNDANGGAGNLRGHMSGVLLKCGNVETFANLYVGDEVPFDLLLGRPWQRDNLVTIDERTDGTYLIFKDPQDVDVTYELLVEDHAPKPDYPFDVLRPPQINQVEFSVGMATASPPELVGTGDYYQVNEMSHSDLDNDSPEREHNANEMSQNDLDNDFPERGHNASSPHSQQDKIMTLFHTKNNLTYLRSKVLEQKQRHTQEVNQYIRDTALRQPWENIPSVFGPASHAFGVSAGFTKALDNFIVQLIRKTNKEIRHKYQEEIDSPQNHDYLRTLLQDNPAAITDTSASHTMPINPPNTDPLSIPANNIPPPPPADVSVLRLTDDDHRTQMDTLAFLWDGFLTGCENLHPTIISSPFGMRFDQRVINGQHIDHAVMYDASLIFFHRYPNPPSIQTGDAYITFIHRPVLPATPCSNPPPPAPTTENLIPTRPATPLPDHSVENDGARPPLSNRPLQRTPLGAVLEAGSTPDAFSSGRANPPPSNEPDTENPEILYTTRCVRHKRPQTILTATSRPPRPRSTAVLSTLVPLELTRPEIHTPPRTVCCIDVKRRGA